MSFGRDDSSALFTAIVFAVLIALMGAAYALFYGYSVFTANQLPLVLHSFFIGTLAYLAAWASARLVNRRDRLRFVTINAAIQSIAVVLFFLVIGRGSLSWTWLLYGLAFVTTIQFGALLFLTIRSKAVARLDAHYPKQVTEEHLSEPSDRHRRASTFEAQFERHSFAWLAIPIGCIVAFVWVAVGHVPAERVPNVVVTSILGTALLPLAYFLGEGSWILAAPLVCIDSDRGRAIVPYSRYFELDIAKAKNHPSFDAAAMDAVAVARELRLLLLHNQHQLLAVTLAATLAVLHLQGFTVLRLPILAPAVLLAAALSQAPFILGQWRAHEEALHRFSGMQRQEQQKKLVELSPLAPTSASWLSLTGSGTLGGVAYALIAKLLNH